VLEIKKVITILNALFHIKFCHSSTFKVSISRVLVGSFGGYDLVFYI